jgi:hypothetical protein
VTGTPTVAGKGDTRTTHAKRQRVLTGDAELVDRYRRTLRAELADVLTELRPESSPGLFGPNDHRPNLQTRTQLVGLADRLVRALTAPLDLDTPGDLPEDAPPPRPSKRGRRIDFG